MPSGAATENTEKDESKNEKSEKNKKNYFEQEYERLKARLDKMKETIEKMKQEKTQQPFTPDIHNSLEPYSDTHTVNYLLNASGNSRESSVSRVTSIGVCEPWESLRMDTTVLPKGEPIPSSTAGQDSSKKKKKDGKEKEGSTHLPKFPRVQIDASKYNNRRLDFSDVPMLRKELRETYTSEAKGKIEEDYQRTMQDYTRMELDVCLDELKPPNRENVRDAMMAYLQNTPGSRKALFKCLREAEKKQKEKEKEEEKENKDGEDGEGEEEGEDEKTKSNSKKKEVSDSETEPERAKTGTGTLETTEDEGED